MVDTTRYNTGNELGSNKLEDMSDNAKNLDLVLNSDDVTFVDRLGKARSTISGLQAYADSALASIGYNFLGVYASGLTIQSPRDSVYYNGILYANAGQFPKLTSGVFSNDGPWVALSSSTGIFIYKFTAIDGQTKFTIGNAVSKGTIPIVFRRGVYQENGDSYTVSEADGRTFIFSEPMSAGDKIQIMAMSGADSVIKGDYQSLIYKNATSAPPVPVGSNPSGWTTMPQTPPAGLFTWVSTARRNGSDNSLIGAWSSPSKFSGDTGQQGASVVDVVNVSSDAASTTYKMQLSNGLFTSNYVVPKGEQGIQGKQGIQGVQGQQGVSIVDVDEVSSDSSSITYRLELSNGSFTSNYTLPKGVSVQDIELVSKVGKTATYRFLLSDSTYTDTFDVLDGLDGSGSVVSVNGVSPDVGGNVTLTAADVGADATGSATTAVSNHVAQGDPHLQYDYRWLNSTANTGDITGSTRCRWLVDTTTTRNRTIGADVRDLLVKDITGKASVNNITITAPAGKTINGAATEVVDVNYGWVQYTLVGTDFKTIGGK